MNTDFVSCKEKSFTEEKEPDFERKHTRDSIYLIHKWICEGLSPKLVGSILNRSEKNVLSALRFALNEGELSALRTYFSPLQERKLIFYKESCTEKQDEVKDE